MLYSMSLHVAPIRPLISCICLVSAGRLNYLSHAAVVLLVARRALAAAGFHSASRFSFFRRLINCL